MRKLKFKTGQRENGFGQKRNPVFLNLVENIINRKRNRTFLNLIGKEIGRKGSRPSAQFDCRPFCAGLFWTPTDAAGYRRRPLSSPNRRTTSRWRTTSMMGPSTSLWETRAAHWSWNRRRRTASLRFRCRRSTTIRARVRWRCRSPRASGCSAWTMAVRCLCGTTGLRSGARPTRPTDSGGIWAAGWSRPWRRCWLAVASGTRCWPGRRASSGRPPSPQPQTPPTCRLRTADADDAAADDRPNRSDTTRTGPRATTNWTRGRTPRCSCLSWSWSRRWPFYGTCSFFISSCRDRRRSSTHKTFNAFLSRKEIPLESEPCEHGLFFFIVVMPFVEFHECSVSEIKLEVVLNKLKNLQFVRISGKVIFFFFKRICLIFLPLEP